MRIDNPRYIRPEDFSEEMKDGANTLATIINPFMQQVSDLTDGRIDIENTVFKITQFEIQVNVMGTPVGNNTINVNGNQIRGIIVINVQSIGTNTVPTSLPFISYSNLGQNSIKIEKITGLPVGRYRITALSL